MRAARRRFMMPLPLLLCLTAAHHRAAAKDAAVAHVTVSATAAHGVDHRIFGVMAERADWDGEGGIEAAWTPARASSEPKGLAFRANLVNLWDRLGATVVRFPGGGLADRYDWRWGIDHVPGRPGPRPLTAREDTPDAVRFLPADTALRPASRRISWARMRPRACASEPARS